VQSWRGHRFATRLVALLPGLVGCLGDRTSDSASQPVADSAWTEDSDEPTDSVRLPRSGPDVVLGLGLLELDLVQTCADPLDAVTYTEQGEALGLLGPLRGEGTGGVGGSLAVFDLDHDGDLDVLIGFPEEPLAVYRWDGGAFVRDAPDTQAHDVNMLNVADLNGDGWLDVITGSTGFPGILWNTAGSLGTVETLSEISDMARIRELAPADVDGDGDVDLYGLTVRADNFPGELWDMFLWNNGDATFTLDTEGLGQGEATGQGFDAGWFDWDDDGDLDVYVANDQGTVYGPDFMLKNDGGVLTNARAECFCGPTHTGMNVDAADFDGDGLFDVFVTTAENNVLLKQFADRTFGDVTLSVGADVTVEGTDNPTGWGAVFFDRDNDGDLDVAVALGDYSDGRNADDDEGAQAAKDQQGQGGGGAAGSAQAPMPIALLEWDDERVYTDVAADLGLAREGSWRSVVTQDLNGDNVLDILMTDIFSAPHLYMSDGCTAASWLRIEAPTATKVTVTAGERTWVDHITHESGYGAAQPANVHIGLGDVATVDRVELRLPDGRTVVSETPFPANRVVRLAEPPGPGR